MRENTLVEKVEVEKVFGTAVRAWRKRSGISQEELAARAGLHRTYICDIERGARNVSLRSIDKLARALEIRLPALFSYDAAAEAAAPGGSQPSAADEPHFDQQPAL